MSTTAPPKRELFREIVDAQMKVLEAADHLVCEYTRKDHGYGTSVGMKNAEDRLIREVEMWRVTCGGNKAGAPR
jgi:hypothetical protein